MNNKIDNAKNAIITNEQEQVAAIKRVLQTADGEIFLSWLIQETDFYNDKNAQTDREDVISQAKKSIVIALMKKLNATPYSMSVMADYLTRDLKKQQDLQEKLRAIIEEVDKEALPTKTPK